MKPSRHFSVFRVWAALVLALAVAASTATGQVNQLPKEPNGFTWGELALLPEYCRDTQGTVYQQQGNAQDSPRAPHWVSLMGKDFWHMHHYCYGLREMLHYESAGKTPQQRRAHLERAVNEYGYLIRNGSPDMVLMPEIHMKIGEARLLLGDIPGAALSFEASRRLKPDYWPSYQKWIAVLMGSKLYDKALDLARQGLAAAPDSQEMKKLLADTEAEARKAKAASGAKRSAERRTTPQGNSR